MKVDTKKRQEEKVKKPPPIKNGILAKILLWTMGISLILAVVLIIAGWALMRAAPDLDTALLTVTTEVARMWPSPVYNRTLEFAGFVVMRTGLMIHHTHLWGTIFYSVFMIPTFASLAILWIIDRIIQNKGEK